MEELIEIVFLGIIQGLTEFLPVSSSGHLVLGQYFLGIKSPGNSLEILFHIGTLGSVVFVFFKDIKDIILKIDKKPTRKLLIFISVATLPAMIIGFLFRHDINRLFENINRTTCFRINNIWSPFSPPRRFSIYFHTIKATNTNLRVWIGLITTNVQRSCSFVSRTIKI